MAQQSSGFAQLKVVSNQGGVSSTQTASNFAQIYSNTLKNRHARDADQQKVFDEVTSAYQNDFDEIDKLPETQNQTLNSNINSFYTRGADQVHQITNQMNEGIISQADGTREIAKLTGYLEQYKTLAPMLIAQADYGMDAIKNGVASKENSGDLQRMLMGIANDKGSISLDEKDGQMYLKDAETGYVMNIQEFTKLASKAGTSIIRTVPTYEDLGFQDTWNGIATLMPSEDVETNVDGKIVTTKAYDKEKVTNEMMRNGVYESLWREDDAASMWYDLMHEGVTIDRFGGGEASDGAYEGREYQKFDPSNQAQQQAIQRWAIETTLDKYMPRDKVTGTKSDGTAEAWEESNRNPTNFSEATKKAKPIYEAINNVYDMLNDKDNTTDPSEIIEQLNSVGSKKGTTVDIDSRGKFIIYDTPVGKDAVANERLRGDIKNPADKLKMYNAYGVTAHLDQLGFGSDKQKALQARTRTYKPKELKELNDSVNKLTDKANPESIKAFVEKLGFGDIVNIESNVFSKDIISIGDFDFEEDSLDWKQDLIDYLKGHIGVDPLDPNS